MRKTFTWLFFLAILLVHTSYAATTAAQKVWTVNEKQQQLKENPNLNKLKVWASPVDIASDFMCPYLPDEALQPATKITLQAAVNEIKPLPLAVTNNTDSIRDIRVVLEAGDTQNLGWQYAEGLKGFPQITMRQGCTIREYQGTTATRFDPLPKMNDLRSVTVPPRESALVWIDFNTTGMKPGTYRGRLLLCPLSGKGEFSGSAFKPVYKGEAVAIPVEFTVIDMVLSQGPVKNLSMSSSIPSEQAIQLCEETGIRVFNISIWDCVFAKDAKGEFIPKAEYAEKAIKLYQKEAAKRNYRPKFFILYSAWNFSKRMHKGSKEDWQKWLKALDTFMTQLGVRHDEWHLELQDEPWANQLPEILEYAKLAKQAAPKVQLNLTIAGNRINKVELLEPLVPYIDTWIMLRSDWEKKQRIGFAKLGEKMAQKNPLNAIYTCETEFSSLLHENYRTVPWMCEAKNFPSADVYQAFRFTYHMTQYDFKTTQEGTLFYGSFQNIIPSVRSMAVRQGMTELKYLDVLRREFPNDPSIALFLKQAPARVIANLSDKSMPEQVCREAVQLYQMMKGRTEKGNRLLNPELNLSTAKATVPWKWSVPKAVKLIPKGGPNGENALTLTNGQKIVVRQTNLVLTEGEKYTFGAWVRTKNFKSKWAVFGFWALGWSKASYTPVITDTQGKWVRIERTATAPHSDKKFYEFGFYSPSFEGTIEFASPFIIPVSQKADSNTGK